MFHRWLAAALVVAALLVPHRAAGADDAVRLRVFLDDGSSLISYGELARVGDRVVFSMPTSAAPDAPLQLVDIPAARVNWDRTNRYAEAARAAHYVATKAESDYAVLSSEVAQALNDVALTTDPAKRLAIVESARRRLGDWPHDHYNYRLAEVRQMLGMLDEAIADLRAATGTGTFNIALTAYADAGAIKEPLLPPPTARQAIEQVLTAARLVDSPSERESLLSAASTSLDRDAASLPSAWLESTRAEVHAAVAREENMDRAYQSMTARMMRIANERSRIGDVASLQYVLRRIPVLDRALGGQRPDAIGALVDAVQARLDAARRVRLARDHWALRVERYRQYWASMRRPISLFAQMTPALGDIKELSGSTPASLESIERLGAQIAALAGAIAPPEELATAHALLVSAVQLANNAAKLRENAAQHGDMTLAWNASSAAAGALMLGAKAQSEMRSMLRPPRLP